MEDTRTPVEGDEGRQKIENPETRALEDATLDPGALIEQTGDIRQAEEVQEAFTRAVENAEEQTRDVGATPLPIPRPEDGNLKGSLPEIREDLDQVTVKGKDTPGGDRATPIPLPGAGGLEATPIPLPAMRVQAGEEEEGHPPEPPDLDHSPFPEESLAAGESENIRGQMPKVRDDLDQAVSSTGESGAEEVGVTPINLPGPQDLESNQTPETPRQEAEFEKPILQEDMEDMGSGLEGMDGIEGLFPGEGKLMGAPGEEDPGSSLLDGMGDIGFTGGVSDLVNDTEHGSGGPEEIPGMGYFKPGKGPGGGKETQGGGSTPLRDTKLQEYLEDEGVRQRIGEMTEANYAGESPILNSGKGEQKTKTDDEVLADKILEASVPKKQNPPQVDDPEKPPPPKSEDPDMGSGKDPNKPIGQQMGGARMDPSTDKDQISNYPEDNVAGTQGGGMLSEENAEKLKRTLENKEKIAHTTPKVKTEQVTDPTNPDLGKKTEGTNKSG